MGGFQANIQALLHDIDANYGDDEHDQPPLPYPLPHSNSYQNQPFRFNRSLQNPVPVYSQQQLPLSQASDIPDVYHYHARNGAGLDGFDRALLAEPALPISWPSSNSMDAVSSGRLTLPGHTASFPPGKPSENCKHLTKRNVPTSLEFRSNLAGYKHTPPAQMNASSPSNEQPSSPSCNVKKRRATNATRHAVGQGAARPSSDHLPARDFLDSSRKGCVRVGEGLDLSRPPPFTLSPSPRLPIQPRIDLSHAPPIVQGVQLVSLNELPDRLRSVFRHPLFNAIQSKCFAAAYKSNDNLVVSAPTGGGKTAILEMAICRLVSGLRTEEYKIVYMAPTKSLCSERQRDWQAKFAALNLQCAELTGDTENGQLRNVQSARIMITTPEKWDSMTRKWKDHAKLMQMVKLFLIDEVHILKDARGATLEAVVSRMKSVRSNVRFIALSATVPNSEDIAKWLGKDASNQHTPALQETFKEEFRPVRLEKHVIGLPYRGNDFGFEGACDLKLPDIISKYSNKKPIMVFCITRNSTINTAKLLANIWASKGPRERYWGAPTQRIVVQDPELQQILTSAVAFHHAGLDGSDRHAVEKGFLEGQIKVICCTSTLAVGVNLPCHMVIIKNTMHWSDDGLKEYVDLEIMQMLGRAGRPQFDTSATAVIITKQEKLNQYEKLVSGKELLESCLHLNLIDHLNAEVGLGTIYDLQTAKKWLAGTFLYVRLGQNPKHYRLDGEALDQSLDDRIEKVCRRDLSLLEESNLITSTNSKLKATELGDAMARYYVKFETMQILLRMQAREKMSAMLSAIVQAQEFHDIRLKASEKKLYKQINQANGIKFPVKVDLAMHAHKRSLIIQAELGGVEFPTDEQYAKHKRQYNQDKAILFSHVHRLIHCLIDCQIHLQDAVAARHALELARSFSARAWDNSPYQMKQIAQIGLVAIRKLAVGGISSIEALEAAEPHRIEMLMSKNPPFGQKILGNIKDFFPKLRVALKLMGKESRVGRPVSIKVKVNCGFMNDKAPTTFNRRPFNVCLLTERSDGHLLDFRRMSSKNLNNSTDVLLSMILLSHTQYITCYVMCDTIAGTLRYAELKPDLPASLFPPPRIQPQQTAYPHKDLGLDEACQAGETLQLSSATLKNDDFGDDEIGDQDMVDAVTKTDFYHIDKMVARPSVQTSNTLSQNRRNADTEHTLWNPEKLDNGKWACNHKCKDKTVCKHMCCREGVDRAPKAPKSAFVSAKTLVDAPKYNTGKDADKSRPIEKMPSTTTFRIQRPARIETLDLAGELESGGKKKRIPNGMRNLQRLHESVVKGPATPVTTTKKSLHRPRLPLQKDTSTTVSSDVPSTDYDGDWVVGLPSPSVLLGKEGQTTMPWESIPHGSNLHDSLPSPSALLRQDDEVIRDHRDNDSLEDFDLSQFNDDEQSDLEAAMVGLSDSITVHEDSRTRAPSKEGRQKMAGAHMLQTKKNNSRETSNVPVPKDTSVSSKLFLSTDSPEKPKDWSQNEGIAIDSVETEDLSLLAPVPKRQRMYSQAEGALQDSSNIETQTMSRTPAIKPGQPAWVYTFDPAFIAEWQDFVDFI